MTEEAKDEKLQLPPYPEGFFDYTEEQEKTIKYSGDMDDLHQRVAHKLYNTWALWSHVRNSEKLIEIVNKQSDTDTDDFYLKATIVNLLDQLGKILGNTHIAEEIIKLSADK